MRILTLFYSSALIIGAFVASHAKELPNIVLIIADDCTYRDLGCYGGQAHTPNIDALASEGMRFTRCFQSAPMCSPTRHSIYTGQHPVKSGAYPNHTFVEEETKSIVQYLKPLGYRVGQSGKTHVQPESVFSWEKIPGDRNPDFEEIDGFIEECTDRREPFCLLLCSNEPHTPWDKGDPSRYELSKIKLPPYFVDTPETREGMQRYLAEITYFDEEVGKTIELLKKHGQFENTLLIVLSEQGSALPFAKWTCYDNGLQSGFIAYWNGYIEPGSTNHAMVEYIDLLPTFIELAGGEVDDVIDGRSLLEVFAGKQDHKDVVFGEMTSRGINSGPESFGIRSVRTDRYKYIWNFTSEVKFTNACTVAPEFQSWIKLAEAGDADALDKVNRYHFRPEFELYDLQFDPLEWNNLAGRIEYEEVEFALRDMLLDWMAFCGDQGQKTEMNALARIRRPKKVK